MCKTTKTLFKTALVGALAVSWAAGFETQAQVCLRCPTDAQGPAIANAFDIYVVRGGATNRVTGSTVGACETLILRANVSYNANATGGGIGAGFTGGGADYLLFFRGGTFIGQNLGSCTPADMATTLVTGAPTGTDACTPPGGTTAVPIKNMLDRTYTLTSADIAAGSLQFEFLYTNGTSLLPDINNQCLNKVSATPQANVFIAPLPTCSIAPPSQTVCAGSSATFTASTTGSSPTCHWTGPNGFTATGCTITITNAQAANAGTYTNTVIDQFGCTGFCTAVLIVSPNPTCSITPATPVCPGSTNVYTSTVLPAGGTVTYSWSITGDGLIIGSTTSASVTVVAGSVGGTYTLTDNVTRNTCPGSCNQIITVNENPTCSITPNTPVCSGSTNVYTSTVLPAGGTVTYSWGISGNGTIVGSTTSASVTVAAGAAGTYTLTDNVTRNGCPGSCNQTITVNPCNPGITVIKLVTCAPATGVAGCDGTLNYGKFAEGVSGTNQPAFCYQIIVLNSGQENLTNVTVTDTLLGALPGYPTNLVIGASLTNYVGMSWGPGNHTNTVIGSGQGGFDGIFVRATNGADVVVVPASVSCQILLSTNSVFNMGSGNGCAVTFPSGTTNPVQVAIQLCNTGQADLNISIIGGSVLTPGMFVDCEDETTVVPVSPVTFFVAAGQCVTNFLGCSMVACGSGATFTATVQGEAVASTQIPCIYDAFGNVIMTATHDCSACVGCAQGVICRVTGGGQLIEGTTSGVSNEFCIVYTTTLSPMVNGTGLQLTKITHGGQVGAPFSMKDCGEVLGNPCIRGQWEHQRHYQGSGNPRDVVTAFHTTTPKGQFDTLNCACLGCCDAAGTFFPGTTGPGHIKKYALCNPDDHKVCGPMPRPSPANAIIITGVGQLTPTTDNGTDKKNTQWVVYRIYIEDRSEPGGQHPGGAVQPADVYCFQAWYTGVATSHKPDYSKIAPLFRSALGADSCAFLDALNTGALPMGSLPGDVVSFVDDSGTTQTVTADIVDKGPMHDGNHQIHPATGATCQ